MPASTLAALRAEVGRLEAVAARRDFAMECMGGSPRHMTTLGGQVIADESPLISGLYEHAGLLRFLGEVAALDALPVRDPIERYVVNILHRRGDTHGAHTDDYPLAVVLFLEAPPAPEGGGLLEYVPDTPDLGSLETSRARHAHHHPGDAYVLRSDTTAHRVTPLLRDGVRRTVLNFAYTTSGRQGASTPSASLLYADPRPRPRQTPS
ncbi:hypothetical protein OG365_32960 [Streptomyces sp. NBC_00853]|uniref:HalD/BesD family halogenase n=1 Tax=Streptomyces sp. NBC_00853 TaxID=2903681 RepID=UPI003873BF25|nr:hypothetical protein OG365_32960 [Streptomyces sp. NBC_00853]